MNKEAAKDQSAEVVAQNDRRAPEEQRTARARRSRTQSERSYTASIYSSGGDSTIPTGLAKGVRRLEKAFSEENGMTTHVWLLIQAETKGDKTRTGAYADLDEDVRKAFFSERDKLSKDKQIVLLIDSSGGSAKSAYQLATFFRHYCGRFVALVPRSAKSAATLLAIGADEIILGNYGELGPVDAQVRDRNEYVPALDRVKTLERLHASALEALDRTMALLTLRSGEDVDKLLPRALDFAARLSQPYLQETDMVDYTRMSRVLKIGEDYASRLLERHYDNQESNQASGYRNTQGGDQPYLQEARRVAEDVPFEEALFGDYSDPNKRKARLIAQHLVGAYPDHAFAIDGEEAKRIGLQVHDPPTHIAPIIDELVDELHRAMADRAQEGLTAIGRVVEAKDG
jgi:hypothetical protein